MSPIDERIDAGERLVEQHDRRVGGQRAGDLAAAPLAARQRHRRRVAQPGQAEFVEQRVELALARAALSGSDSSSTARMFFSTDSPRKIEVSCGR